MGEIKSVGDIGDFEYSAPDISYSNNTSPIITPEYEQMMLLSGDVEQMELAAGSVSAGSNIEAVQEVGNAINNNISELLSIRTVEDLKTYLQHNIATLQTHIYSAGEAIMKIGENIGDGITGAFAASSAAQLESYGVLDPNDRESTLQEVAEGIAVDHTENYWNDYWNSDEGKAVDDASYLKHDGIYNEGIKGVTTMAGYVAMSIFPPGWVTSAASVAGESYETTIQNGGTLSDAYVNAAPAVIVDGLLNIVGAKSVGGLLRGAASSGKQAIKSAYENVTSTIRGFEFPKLGDFASETGAKLLDFSSTIWNRLADEKGFLDLGSLFRKGQKSSKGYDDLREFLTEEDFKLVNPEVENWAKNISSNSEDFEAILYYQRSGYRFLNQIKRGKINYNFETNVFSSYGGGKVNEISFDDAWAKIPGQFKIGKPKNYDSFIKIHEEIADRLEEKLSLELSGPTTVYRGVGKGWFSQFGLSRDASLQEIKRRINDVVGVGGPREAGFMSTSYSKYGRFVSNAEIVLKYDMPKGQKYGALFETNKFNPDDYERSVFYGEQELLFPPGIDSVIKDAYFDKSGRLIMEMQVG